MQHILHSELFSHFPEIVQGTSTKFFGPLSFTYSKSTNEVIIDRARFLNELGLNANHSVLVCEQNHTNNIITITDEHIGHGLFDQSLQIPDADGMVTNLPDINLVIYTADCMPVSFCDPVKKVIGVAHSGWKGTIGDISKNLIQIMQEKYGSEIQDIRVSVGPSIGSCCYSVTNQEQLDLFEKKYNNLVYRNNQIYVDLWDSIQQDMLSMGILESNLENTHICTACKNHIYATHRKDNPNTTANLTVMSIRT